MVVELDQSQKEMYDKLGNVRIIVLTSVIIAVVVNVVSVYARMLK